MGTFQNSVWLRAMEYNKKHSEYFSPKERYVMKKLRKKTMNKNKSGFKLPSNKLKKDVKFLLGK